MINHSLIAPDQPDKFTFTFLLRVPGTRTPPLGGARPTNLYRNASMPASTARPTVTHKMMEQKNNSGTKTALAARSGSGAKEMILMWVQNRIRDYPVREKSPHSSRL